MSAAACRSDPAFLFELRIPGQRKGEAPIVIRAFELPYEPATGRTPMTLSVSQGDNVIFRRGGALWGSVNAFTSIDGKEAKEHALFMVSLKPGDTDAEAFAGYTEAQKEWCSDNGDYLSMIREERYGDS